MIFISVGSQQFQFNRLLVEIDKSIEEKRIQEDVFAQIGFSDYIPKFFKYKKFLDKEEFDKKLQDSSIIIAHGGTGTIMKSIKKNKKVITVPRLAQHGEHVDNHQMQIVKQFELLNLIYPCYEVNHLVDAIELVKNKKFTEYKSSSKVYNESINNFLLSIS